MSGPTVPEAEWDCVSTRDTECRGSRQPRGKPGVGQTTSHPGTAHWQGRWVPPKPWGCAHQGCTLKPPPAPWGVSHQVFRRLGGAELGPAQVRSAQELGDRPLHLEVHLDAVVAHLGLPHLQDRGAPPRSHSGYDGSLRAQVQQIPGDPLGAPALSTLRPLDPWTRYLQGLLRTQNKQVGAEALRGVKL